MVIFIDTSVFCQDFTIAGRKFKILLDRIEKLNDQLVISTLVIDELVNKYSEGIEAKLKKLASSERDLRRILFDSKRLARLDLAAAAETEPYRTYVAEKLANVNARIVELPHVSHAEVVRRELSRKRPFSAKGTGYRDFMIWQSFLAVANECPTPAVFVSLNTRDFFDGENLHPDLIADLRGYGLTERVRAFSSLESLIDSCLEPRYDSTKTLAQLIEQGKSTKIDLKSYLSSELLSTLNQADLPKELLNLPPGTGTVEIEKILKFGTPRSIDTYKFDRELIEITGYVDLEVAVSMCFSWVEYYQIAGVAELFEDTDAEDLPSFELRENREVEVSFSAVWDCEDHDLYGLEVVQLF